MELGKQPVWIDIHGNRYYDFSEIDDGYLKNIAFAVAKRKGNVRFLKNNQKALDDIFDEAARRNIFYNGYDKHLKAVAYEIWLGATAEEDDIDEDRVDTIFGRIVNNMVRSARVDFEEEDDCYL